jgi:hypothetical protein
MSEFTAFQDVETVLMTYLTGVVTGATCGTATPDNLGDVLPFIRIMRIGGGDDRHFDTAKVSIDSFGLTRMDSYTLGEAIRQALLSYPIVIPGTPDQVIDLVTTETAPQEIPWGDVNVRRRNAVYSVWTRRSIVF